MLQLCFQSALFSVICKQLKQIAGEKKKSEDIDYEGKQGDPAACSDTW